MSVALLFLIIAAVLFGIATFGVASGRFNLVAAGLCSMAIAFITEHF